MGSAAHRADRDMGHFKGYVFNNGHIVMRIGRDYGVIEDTRGHILISRAYPVVEIKRGAEWEELNFEERFMIRSDHRGWRSVGIGLVHREDVEVRGFLEYYQRDKFREGAPLYPLFLLYFNRSVEHRVIWRYEGIGTNYFEVIDNGSGWTRAPYREGHGRTIIYNGTVHGIKEFEKGQDIVVGWIDGKKKFGLNWERSKFRFRELRIDVEEDVSMEILSEPAVTEEGNGYTVDVYEPPHPDTGGGGSSDDADGDGLPDSQEEAGWWIWVCTSGSTWHHILVHSDPNNPDTDGDYVSDEAEYEHGTNPQDEDTDNDGLTDRQEIYYYSTYGYTWDSDGDGLSDKEEIDDGTNPMEYTYRWLVMLYLDGDNNLYSEISVEKENMLSHYSQLTQPVKVTMLFDGNSNGDTVYYQITKNGFTSINIGEEDMGNSNTLEDFIKRSHGFYPDAERIILVLSNHGDASLGVCEDDNSNGDMLSMNELQYSLSYANRVFNKKIDVLYFQACLMQQIEVGYVIKDLVQDIIGSQWLMDGSSFSTFPWRIVINKISKSPESSVNDVAKAIAEGDIANSDDYIIAVQNAGYLGDIADLINKISDILITNITQVKNEIMKVINNPWFNKGHAKGYPYRDLKHFFEWLKENLTISGYEDSTLERYISLLIKDFARSVYTVFSSDERAHLWFQGVGIFLPVNSQENREDFITDFERYGAPRWFDLTQLLLEG